MLVNENTIVAAYIEGKLRTLGYTDYSKMVKILSENNPEKLKKIFIDTKEYLSLVSADRNRDAEAKDEFKRVFSFLVYVLEIVDVIETDNKELIYLSSEDADEELTLENASILVVSSETTNLGEEDIENDISSYEI